MTLPSEPDLALTEALAAMPAHFPVGVKDGLSYDPDDNECAACGEDWPCPTSRLVETARAVKGSLGLREAALALFEPMDHGSPSKPNAGHTVESHCGACVSVRAKRTQAIRRALVQLGDLPSVSLRAANHRPDVELREALRNVLALWDENAPDPADVERDVLEPARRLVAADNPSPEPARDELQTAAAAVAVALTAFIEPSSVRSSASWHDVVMANGNLCAVLAAISATTETTP